MKEDSYSSLIHLARSNQNDPDLSAVQITKKQVMAVQTRISKTKLKLSREERLECLREILGYNKVIHSTWDLSMADAGGLIELEDADFNALFSWALMKLSNGVQI